MNRKMKEKKRMKKIGAALLLVIMLLNISIITALADMSYTLKYTSGGLGGTVVREESGTVALDPADASGATYEMINLLSEFTEGNFKYTLENNQPDLENAGRFLPDEPGFIPDNNPIASPSFAVYVREEMIFSTTAIYVDENDNYLMDEALSGTDGEWKPLQREFEVNGIRYEVPEQPQLDQDFYRYDAAAGGEIKPGIAPGDFTVNCVRKPAVQPRRYGYEIHYTDEAGNILIPDQGGAAEDMEW